MDHTFCTLMSKGRLYQGLLLICSLNQVMENFCLYTLCMDDETYNLLKKMGWTNVALIHVRELENEILLSIKRQRKVNEYCWTLKPILLETVFNRIPSIDRITFIDADLFFWSDPAVIFSNQPECSVLLSRGDLCLPMHPTELTKYVQEMMGNYNGGFLSFKRDESGLACLRWWKEKCLEWCSDTPEAGRYGDQKYLDYMPYIFRNVCDIKTPGVNIGHWNYPQYTYNMEDGQVFTEQGRLICYHFSGFRIVNKDDIRQIHEEDRTDIPPFYSIYKKLLRDIITAIEEIEPAFNGYATAGDLKTDSEKEVNHS